jgi:hypothetical protein
MTKSAMIKWLLRHGYKKAGGIPDGYFRTDRMGLADHWIAQIRHHFVGDVMISNKRSPGCKWEEFRREDVSRFFIGEDDQLCLKHSPAPPEHLNCRSTVRPIAVHSRYLTPNEVEVLIHYLCSPQPHPRVTAPAVVMAIKKFVNDEIFKVIDDEAGYAVTDKGRAFVDMILSTPYPENRWVDPREGK